jgi:hypothetical protein
LDGVSGKPCGVTVIDIPSSSKSVFGFSDAVLAVGNSPFIYMVDTLVFDMRTRIFYEFPGFLIVLVCGG